jgi:FKBP-type peptidyl-prolyl cis-trans isomerase 2
MAQASNGNTVKVHYTGKLADGTVFDSSREREPLEFTLGQGQIIPGFEEAVTGMEEGESKVAEIPSDKAYGPHRDELVVEVGKDQFPEDIDPQVGQRLQTQTENGQTVPVVVTEVQDDSVKLDANHPLAGKDLTFEIEIVEVA